MIYGDKILKTEDGLESLLKMRENQYTMLRNTLDQLMNGDIDSILGCKSRIRMIQNELDNTINEIGLIKQDLSELKGKETNEAECGLYDSVKKPDDSFEGAEKVNESFYDSIVRQPKIAKVMHNCGSNFIWHNVDAKFDEDAVSTTASTSVSNKYLKKIQESDDDMMRSNRFIVNIEYALGIPDTMVKKVCFDDSNHSLMLTVYDFVKYSKWGDYPIIKRLNSFIGKKFSFSIDHLDSDGKVKYTESYDDCVISDNHRSCLDYSDSDISTIEIVIRYGDVKYETSQ